MTFGGGNLRGQNIPVTAENSGHSYNQLIVNLLNTPILRRMGSSDYFPSMHPPPNVISQRDLTLARSYLKPVPAIKGNFLHIHIS
jgi:hypothetical protein